MSKLNTLERIRIKANDNELQKVFDRLEQESEDLPGFHILFGHHVLLLRFPDIETAEKYRLFFDLISIEYEGVPDGTITILQKEIEDYMSIGEHVGRAACWEYSGENGYIRFVKWPDRTLVYQTQSNRQYVIMRGPLEEYVPFWASFHCEFHNFAMSSGYAFIHTGAVGLNGEGVLISAMGGCGKSTTVLSCLLDGFDYVSDDYLIMDRETAAVYPVYNSGILNGDSLLRLPELKPLIYGRVFNRPNRYIIDLSKYRKQFCSGMKIRAIVYPHVISPNESEEALIRKDPLHKAKTQLLVSSARQNGFGMMWEQDDRHWIFDAVRDLPSFELLLSPDRQSNCRTLREFILDLSKKQTGTGT